MKTNKLLLLIVTLLLTGGKLFSQNWQMVWSDEFTSGISSDWVFETGAGGWGNGELEYYRQENASVSNGVLMLTAKHESFGGANYTSVRMKTQGKKSWTYGKIEARIALPGFQGSWPAFWMLGDNISSVGWPGCGEIDIMEQINTGGTVYGSAHWKDANGNQADISTGTGTSITGYHVYSIEWTSSYIRWFVDGNKYNELNISGNAGSTEEFQRSFFILLNLAVGGNWPGFSVDNNAFPASMAVDYVRVYKDAGGVAPTGVTTICKDCNFGGYNVLLPVGNYDMNDLIAKGISNDDISSLKVNSGYQVQLFADPGYSGASTVITADNACLVANGWNDITSSLKVTTVGNTTTSGSGKVIQAESFSSMAGVQTETTTDAGGGQDVGYIDTGDWMAYNSINVPSSGTYTIQYRVASVSGGKVSMDLNAGSVQLGAVNIPATGGWQTWTTVSQTVNLNAGTYNFGIYAQTGGWNINWWSLTPGTTTTTTTTSSFSKLVQAESFSAMLGVQNETTTDAGGGQDVGYIDANDWMVYNSITFPTSGTYTIQYRVASPSGSKLSMDLNAGAIQLGTINIPATGGWQTWTTVNQTVNVNAGTYNVGIYAQAGGWNINWFNIVSGNGAKVGQFDASSSQDVTTNYNLGSTVEIYPNPIDGELMFVSATDLTGGQVKIVNSLGAEVVSTLIESDKVDVSGLNAGMYVLLVNKDGNKFTKKFIKR